MNERKTPAIEVLGLAKSFDGVHAVAGVDFTIFQGDLFGFLGPNGAGKTTTINMLTGLARPDSGTIRIMGINCSRKPKAAQHLLGVVPDESNLYPELTGFENLCFCAALYGMGKKERTNRAQELLSTFGLADAAHRKFATYSKGMKRKLTIAAGIAHRPQILFLDEPTTGIDVASALDFSMPQEGVIRAESTEAVQVGPVIRLLDDCGAQVYEARRIRPSLEDVFVRITGIEADAMQKEKEPREKEE